MKKRIYLIVMVLLAFAMGTFAQNITISSGGVPIATGINQTISYTVCEGTSLTLTVSYAGVMDHVIWSSNVGGAGVFAPNNTSFTVTVNPLVTTDYTVYVYDAPANLAGYLKLSVFVSPNPITQTVLANGVVGKEGHYCAAGATFSLGSSQVGSTYQMQDDGTSNDVGAPVAGTGTGIQFAPVAAGSYQILVTSAAGCTTIIR